MAHFYKSKFLFVLNLCEFFKYFYLTHHFLTVNGLESAFFKEAHSEFIHMSNYSSNNYSI